jgi:hypothetical protein
MNPAKQSTHQVAKLFEGIRFGTPKRVEAVTLVPLIRDGDDGPDALLLEEGIRGGHSRVAEVSESGVVNAIRVEHDGALPLLILDGELVLGAKQNRLFNR